MAPSRDSQVVAVINADDFGISPQVSREILSCFEAGRISSTTIMANLPDFEDACGLAERHGLTDRIGVHLNLTFGPPLSEAMRRYCGEGGSLATPERRLSAPRDLVEAVEAEVGAQITRVREAGIEPTHVDSHEHIINGFPYTRVAIRAARALGIRKVRLTRNAFYHKTPLKWLFKSSYNRYLRWSGMRTVRYFTDVKPYFSHVRQGGSHLQGPLELMCHPGATLVSPVLGYGTETALLLGPEFAEFLEGVRLVSYRDL